MLSDVTWTIFGVKNMNTVYAAADAGQVPFHVFYAPFIVVDIY